MTRRGCARFQQPACDPFQVGFIHTAAQQFQPLLIAIVVRIDVHQPLESLCRLRYISRGQIHVEKPDQHFEILRFAIQFVVDGGPEFKNNLRMGVFGPYTVHQRREIVLPFVGKHPPLERQEDIRGFLVLARGHVPVRQFEQLGHAFIFFAEDPLE